MGELMNRSGMGERMYAGITRWIWWLPGGLIHTNIVSCAIFAACSGSSVATSATISRVSLPSFRQRGYSERMVIGSLAAGGTLGILIPPSISLIIYGVLVEESIGRLYMAGFVPGMVLTLSFIVMILLLALIWRGLAPREHGDSFFTIRGWANRLMGSIALVPIVALVIVVIGSIYGGIATPSGGGGIRGLRGLCAGADSQYGRTVAPDVRRRDAESGLINGSTLVKWTLGLLVGLMLAHLVLQIALALTGADLNDPNIFLGAIVGENIFLVEVVLVPWTGWTLSSLARRRMNSAMRVSRHGGAAAVDPAQLQHLCRMLSFRRCELPG